jgi:hypothetical protein
MPKAKKKNIKVRDLKPKKDAKGGFGVHRLSSSTGSHTGSNLGSHTGSNLGSHTGQHN